MTLQEIVNMIRMRLNNYEIPYYWLDSELVMYINNGINEICRDGLVLNDSMTASVCDIPTVVDTSDYALSSSIIFIRSAKIVTEELMTLDVTPATAWATGDTLTGALSTKTCKVVSKISDYTYLVENRTGSFTLGESISNGTVTADQGVLYPKFTETKVSEMEKTFYRDMNERYSSWRATTSAQPYKYMLDYNTGYITVYPKPDEVYMIRLSVARYPIIAMTTTTMSGQTPEIDARYDNDIINYVCSQAYLKSGENTFDVNKAAAFAGLFKKGLHDIKRRTILYRGMETIAEPSNGHM